MMTERSQPRLQSQPYSIQMKSPRDHRQQILPGRRSRPYLGFSGGSREGGSAGAEGGLARSKRQGGRGREDEGGCGDLHDVCWMGG